MWPTLAESKVARFPIYDSIPLSITLLNRLAPTRSEEAGNPDDFRYTENNGKKSTPRNMRIYHTTVHAYIVSCSSVSADALRNAMAHCHSLPHGAVFIPSRLFSFFILQIYDAAAAPRA